jgi:hypothetical protein
VISRVYLLIDQYGSSDYECPQNQQSSFQCGSFLLGALLKELDRINLRLTRPEVPFPGLSFNGLCEVLRSIQSPEWYEKKGSYRHICNLRVRASLILAIAPQVAGLDLAE